MHTTIYFNNKPLFITNEITEELEEYVQHNETVLMDEFDTEAIKAMLQKMGQSTTYAGVFLYKDVETVFKTFQENFVTVKAAGGLVHTPENDLLLIFRRGKWDLPKGKLDEGEHLQTCALREIKEETGLENIQMEQPLCITYHTYQQNGEPVLKETHWFLIVTEKQNNFLPQLEEDIEKCEWVAINQLSPYIENTHASILDVLNAGMKILS